MKFLTSVSFEKINKVRITLLNHINSLKVINQFFEIEATDFNLLIREGDNTQIIIDEVTPSLESLSLFEEQSYYIVIESNTAITEPYFLNPFLNSIISWYPINIFSFKSNYKFKYIGEFKTKSNVGIWDFSTELLPNLFINISSFKIDYNEDFRKLISYISESVLYLTNKFGDVHKLPYSNSFETNDSLFLESIHLQTYINDLFEAVDYIISTPYSNIIEKISYVPLGTQKQTDYVHLVSTPQNYIWREEGPLNNYFKGFTPITINNIEKISNLDNPPNRFVKFVLEYFSELLYEIKGSIEKIPQKSSFDNIRLSEVSTWIEDIEERLNHNFFKTIGNHNFSPHTSQVLEKRVGYQDINLIFNNIQTALKIDFESQIEYSDKYYSKPISDLYEIWCFLNIVNIILEEFEQNENQSLINVVNDRIKVNLKHGQESKITFTEGSKTVNLYYNYLYSSPDSYTESYKPDITLEIIDELSIKRHHFDAKYKINKKNNSFKEEDLWKMHAYKDSIKFSCTSSILYPGTNLKTFNKHDHTSINTIPLRPSNTTDFSFLKNFIHSLLK